MTEVERTPAPVSLPETVDFTDAAEALDIASARWRYGRERRRYDRINARADGLEEGPRKDRMETYAEHVAMPAMHDAYNGLVDAVLKLRPPTKGVDTDDGVSVVRLGDELIVAKINIRDDGRPADMRDPILYFVPIGNTATVEADRRFNIPEGRRKALIEAERGKHGLFAESATFNLNVPGVGPLNAVIWAGKTEYWRQTRKDPRDQATWMTCEFGPHTIALMAYRPAVLDVVDEPPLPFHAGQEPADDIDVSPPIEFATDANDLSADPATAGPVS